MHKVFAHTCLALAGASVLLADGTGPFVGKALVPKYDIWMYPHGSGGARETASTFTALPSPATETHVEDRFGQFVIRFDTTSIAAAGLGVDNYQPERIVLTAALVTGGIVYDPTPDAYQTSAPKGTPDLDPGRPLEVHGTGFRGGATVSNYNESSSYGNGSIHGRNAYAMGYTPAGVARDVSHNVTEGFDSIPWGVGRIYLRSGDGAPDVELNPGAAVPAPDGETPPPVVKFELNLALPGVAAYVRESLNRGYIWLTISSLHSTTQNAASGYPAFYTKEHPEHAMFGDVAATLDVEYSLPIRVLSFSRNATTNTASISWNASKGYKYVLQRSEELTAGSWVPVNTYQPTDSGTLTWSGPSASPKAFYRVIRTK
ncbi:MAG: hypothetical protein EOP85_05880 [Verrucomicrobiaceae bacterium]|nr:MAG: hypothetical protein EOP85_05880 [Verrucomicrobiaceae bacterium]